MPLDDPSAPEVVAPGLPVLPLRDLVILPHMPAAIIVGRPSSVSAVQEAGLGEIFLIPQRNGQFAYPPPEQLHEVGVLAQILEVAQLEDGTLKVMLEGLRRARVSEIRYEGRHLVAVPAVWEVPDRADSAKIMPLVATIRKKAAHLVRISAEMSRDLVVTVQSDLDPELLCDKVAGFLGLGLSESLALLTTPSVAGRLTLIQNLLDRHIQKLEKEQRLEQNIRKLGQALPGSSDEADGKPALVAAEDSEELAELAQRVEQSELPPDVAHRAQRELRKLRQMSPMNAEAAVLRSWLDWVVSLPWTQTSETVQELKVAAAQLDEGHLGLDEVKAYVLEYLAVERLAPERHGPILCLAGPPGVGKTSLARAVAQATGRPFVRIALGGVRDESEIRGHRRTYIGAVPGRIIHAMRRAQFRNPVILLDEIDKMASDYRGDPTAALLEVLDPEQNTAFNDNYLEVDYDLSQVMFICTANRLDAIPLPLRDRLEIVEISGYTEPEKLAIAKRMLVPKQREAAGLEPSQVVFEDDALLALIRGYTREAGVRGLEREISRICRKLARQVLEGVAVSEDHVTAASLEGRLGPANYELRRGEDTDLVGLVKGLSVSVFGGELLDIEAAVIPGKGVLKITGLAGDMLKESANAALTWLRARADVWGLPADLHEKFDVHIHYPGVGSGVEGPSAGVAMACALTSAFTGRRVRHELAMTGEISLRGRVMPVGGIKEKVMAAYRAGVRLVLIPQSNRKDLVDIPEIVFELLEIRTITSIDEAIACALLPLQDEIPMEKGRSSLDAARPSVN